MSFKEFVNEKDQQDDEDKVMDAIKEYFSTHENPNDEEVHALADSLGYKEGGEKDVHEFEGKIYKLLSDLMAAEKSTENEEK